MKLKNPAASKAGFTPEAHKSASLQQAAGLASARNFEMVAGYSGKHSLQGYQEIGISEP